MMSDSCEEIKETSERSESSNEMSLDVKAIMDSIKKDFVQVSLDDEFGAKEEEATTYTIHRVPQEMRDCAQYSTYFVPERASIGPVYRGNTTELRRGEIDKLKAIRAFVPNHQGILEKIINEIGSSIVALARKCYQKELVESLDDETLVRIMVLDGLYVILAVWYSPDRKSPYMKPYMAPDLLMLENQIPYPVLERLLHYVGPCIGNDSSYFAAGLTDRADYFLCCFSGLLASVTTIQLLHMRPFRPHFLPRPLPPPDGSFHHLLHLLHESLDPKRPLTGSCWYGSCCNWISSCWYHSFWVRIHRSRWYLSRLDSSWWYWFDSCRQRCRRLAASLPCNNPAPVILKLRSATQLLEVGVKFNRPWRRSFIDVSFRRGYIEIPHLSLNSSTVTVLLNLVAFEKCMMPGHRHHVTVYLAFMNSLMDTAKDVDLLVSSLVLDNKLGTSEDVANFFDTAVGDKMELLKTNRTWFGHYLSAMMEDLRVYCAKRRHRNWAKFERDYLSSPWSVISLAAGTLLLILTVAQTFIAYYSYFRPPKT